METLKILKIAPEVKTPEKKNPTDSGFDVYAYSFKKYYQNHGTNFERDFEGEPLRQFVKDGQIELASQDRVLIGTGLKATVGEGYEIQIRPRSGLALKQGLTVLNTPATIDEAYRDEIGIILINLSRKNQIIRLGERVAQLVVCPILLSNIEVVTELPSNNRGGGFGSSGLK
jgi:dUTP pyrophosphatase